MANACFLEQPELLGFFFWSRLHSPVTLGEMGDVHALGLLLLFFFGIFKEYF